MKKFLKKIAPFVLFIFILEIAIPMAVDPYNVFHWENIRDNGVEPNSNYIKMEYILHNPDKFDSFLFGSSRTGFVNTEKIPEGKWYNMSYSEGLPAEHLENLRELIEHGIIPKNVMIGVDNLSCFVDPALHENQFYRIPGLPAEHLENLRELIEHGIIPKNVMIGVDNLSCFVDPALHENQFYRIPYPRENKLGFYANYFSIKGVLLSLDVIRNYEPEDPDYVERYYRSGSTLRDPSLAGTWKEDAPYWDDYYADCLSDSIDSMRQIAELCKEHGIRLIVFTNPIYYKTYQQSKYYGYDNYLGWLAGAVGGFYNFSGINPITTDRSYYYESSHFTEEAGDLIIERIFEGKTDASLESQGFGMYVTNDNMEEFKEALANH